MHGPLNTDFLVDDNFFVSEDLGDVQHGHPVAGHTVQVRGPDAGHRWQRRLRLAAGTETHPHDDIGQDPDLHVAGLKDDDLVQVGDALDGEIEEPAEMTTARICRAG